jgi:hypothetical protein
LPALAAAPLAVVTVTGTAFGQSEGQYEAAVFGVNLYGGSGQCGSGAADLDHTVDDMNEVRNRLAAQGYQVSSTNNANEGTDGRDFLDTTKGGLDHAEPNGTDWADVIFYSGHGRRVVDQFSAILMGDNEEVCEPNTRDHFRFGSTNGDANALILAACQSMQMSVWNNGGYWTAFAGIDFSMFMGFNGNSFDSTDNTNRYGDYIVAAQNNGIGSEWVDLLTDLDPFISNNDQCATIMIAGNSASQRRDQYNNGGFKDFHQPTTHAGSTYFYWCSCDADVANPLPGC